MRRQTVADQGLILHRLPLVPLAVLLAVAALTLGPLAQSEAAESRRRQVGKEIRQA